MYIQRTQHALPVPEICQSTGADRTFGRCFSAIPSGGAHRPIGSDIRGIMGYVWPASPLRPKFGQGALRHQTYGLQAGPSRWIMGAKLAELFREGDEERERERKHLKTLWIIIIVLHCFYQNCHVYLKVELYPLTLYLCVICIMTHFIDAICSHSNLHVWMISHSQVWLPEGSLFSETRS